MRPSFWVSSWVCGLIGVTVLGLPVVAQGLADRPAAAISARQGLMDATESLLAQLESDYRNGVLAPEQMVASTQAIGAMIDGFVLLFPEASNLIGTGQSLEGVTTSADPRIWAEFEAFAGLASAAAATSRSAALDNPVSALAAMRQSCTDCHSQYLYFDPFAFLPP